jgi:hypothetical protein
MQDCVRLGVASLGTVPWVFLGLGIAEAWCRVLEQVYLCIEGLENIPLAAVGM